MAPELLLAEHLLPPAQGQLLLVLLLTAWACGTGGIQRYFNATVEGLHLRLVRERVEGRLGATGATRTRNFKFEIASRHLGCEGRMSFL